MPWPGLDFGLVLTELRTAVGVDRASTRTATLVRGYSRVLLGTDEGVGLTSHPSSCRTQAAAQAVPVQRAFDPSPSTTCCPAVHAVVPSAVIELPRNAPRGWRRVGVGRTPGARLPAVAVVAGGPDAVQSHDGSGEDRGVLHAGGPSGPSPAAAGWPCQWHPARRRRADAPAGAILVAAFCGTKVTAVDGEVAEDATTDERRGVPERAAALGSSQTIRGRSTRPPANPAP